MIKKANMEIWGRKFSLIVEYDCYKGEEITQKQIRAFETFCNNPDWVTNSKSKVIEYCKKELASDYENQKKDNIFSYVMPEAVFIKRDDIKQRVALLCKYRYNLEQGLAIVFNAKGEAIVGTQDIIL